MVVAKLCRKPTQQTKVPLGKRGLSSDRNKVAVACSSCIKNKIKFLYVGQLVYEILGAKTQVRTSGLA